MPARELTRGLPETPDNARVLMLAARVYAAGAIPRGRRRAAARGQGTDPANLQASALLGQLLLSQQKLRTGQDRIRSLATRRPGHSQRRPPGNTMVALVLSAQNRRAEAQKQYEQILAASPRSVVAANNLAWMYAEQGSNLDVALRASRRRRWPRLRRARPQRHTRVGLLQERACTGQAIAAFRRSVDKDARIPSITTTSAWPTRRTATTPKPGSHCKKRSRSIRR
jgi:tetratricopeptide (TPR) repeat protein